MIRETKNYDGWVEKLLSDKLPLMGLKPKNEALVNEYLKDMHMGLNVASKSRKGSRSAVRLVNLRSKLKSTLLLMETYLKIKDITTISEKNLHDFFTQLRNGKIKNLKNNKPYKDVGSIVKAFKSFWNWYARKNKKEGKAILNITSDLDATSPKPKWNYFSFEEFIELTEQAKPKYQLLIWFLYDSGIRAPKELINVQVKDLNYNETKKYYELTIKEESSKTFGRRIKLLLSSKILRKHIQKNNLKSKDYLFNINQQVVNKYLKRLGNKILGIGTAKKVTYTRKDGKKDHEILISNGLTLYDFRHNSACYWLPRYKSESALKYRFGWKKSEMIHYYTEFLGMKDTIQEEDMYMDTSKTELENQLINLKRDLEIKEEASAKEIENLNKKFHKMQKQLLQLTKNLVSKDLQKK